MNTSELPNDRPAVALIGGLQMMIQRMGADSIEAGMTRRAVFAGKITSSSELESLKDNLEAQIFEEEGSLQDAGVPTENDPVIETIRREIIEIEGLLNFSTGINQRFEDEVKRLEERIGDINKDGSLKDKEEVYIRHEINGFISTMQLFKLSGEELLIVNLSNPQGNTGQKQQDHIEATINRLVREIKTAK
jgi:hypothetical protein